MTRPSQEEMYEAGRSFLLENGFEELRVVIVCERGGTHREEIATASLFWEINGSTAAYDSTIRKQDESESGVKFRTPLRCTICRLHVVVRDEDTLRRILALMYPRRETMHRDLPAVRRVASDQVEIPLSAIARMLGTSGTPAPMPATRLYAP